MKNKPTFFACKIFILLFITSLTGYSQVTVSGALSGNGSYTTLRNAFTAINGASQTSANIIITLNADTDEGTSTATLNAGTWSTMTITPNGNRIITGATTVGNPMINFNGADNVTINGLNSGGNSLTIQNTLVTNIYGTATVKFISDASNNTITNCTIAGANGASNTGTVFIATGTTTGNDNITISNCTITSIGSNLPAIAIFSTGSSTAIDNGNISILNNNIQDFFSPTGSSAAVYMSTNNATWTISGNKIFQTGTRTATADNINIRGIYVASSNGGNIVTNNIIGYANASGTGTTVYDGNFSSTYSGIEMTGASVASSIQGNTVSGINFTTSNNINYGNGVFSGILYTGAVNVGNTTGNIIGSSTVNNAIVINSTVTTCRITGISINSASATSTIQNNTIGGISATGLVNTASTLFSISIAGTSGNYTVTDNIIGSTSVANSITVGTSGFTTTGVCSFYGIYNSGASGTISMTGNTVMNCSVYGTAASNFYGIYTASGSGTLTINSNTIADAKLTGTGGFTAISNSAVVATLNMNSNILRNISITSGFFAGIQNTGAVTTAINMNNNQLGDTSGGLMTITAANSSSMSPITNTNATINTAVTIQYNDIRGIVYSVSGSGTHIYIGISNVATLSQNISNNTFTNLSVATSGNVTFISSSLGLPSGGSQLISNNSISGTFAKTVAGGTLTFFTTSATSNASSTITNTYNNFSNVTTTGATTVMGWNQRDLGLNAKTISNNTFSNWSGGSGIITVMSLEGFGNSSAVNSNTISSITCVGNAVTGISLLTAGNAASVSVSNNSITGLSSTGAGGNVSALVSTNNSTIINVNNNTINTLSSSGATHALVGIQATSGNGTMNIYSNILNAFTTTGATSPIIYGISNAGATTVNIYKNKMFDFSNTAAGTGNVNGISITGGVNVLAYNNLISDLKAPLTSNNVAVKGINVNSSTASSTYKFYYNSVYLNATSSGANFGTAGIYHLTNGTATTAKLDLKNNVIINKSTPNGTGRTVANYRSSSTLTNYDTTSNRNLYYAGTPGATRLIFYDGTNSDQLLPAFQIRVSPRESNSVTENSAFLSTSGASSDFLRPDTGSGTYIESAGVNIAGITDDYEATIRQGNPGYSGSGTAPDLGAYEINGTAPFNPITVTGALVGNGTYITLGSAFSAINGGVQTGANIAVSIVGNTDEANSVAQLNAGAWNTLTINPVGNRTVTGVSTAGSPLISFNGADNVTINGLNTGGNSLTISNATVSATAGTATISFTADATNNTITNSTVLGSVTGPLTSGGNGVISFGAGTSTGNDNNTISNCNIGPMGSNLPSVLIFSSGSTASSAIANSSITINNCNLYDYFSTDCAAIYATTGNTDWNITNNKVYQSATRNATSAGTVYGIYFANSTYGNNIQITGNTVGYATNSSTGTYTLTGSTINYSFYGIYFQGMTTAASACNLNGNTVSDISVNSSLGALTAIVNATGSSSNTINMNNNTVKNITLLTSAGIMIGIDWGGATNINVTGNTVYGLTRNGVANMFGIGSTSVSSINENISNNTVYNLSTTALAPSIIICIYQATTAGTKTYQNNLVHDITGASGAGIYGIAVGAGTADISNNTVYNIASTGGANLNLIGIRKATNSATTSNIYRNKVYALSSTATNPVLLGIYSAGTLSTTNIYNNLVSGLSTPAANAANPANGIWVSGGAAVNAYYNTVLLSGTSSGALFGSSAFYTVTGTTTTLRNNILINNCVPTGAGLATAYRRADTTLGTYDAASNNNLFYGSTIFTDGTNTDATLSAYKTRVSPRDAASVSGNQAFISTTGSSVDFLHVDSTLANFIESKGAAIGGYTTDFDGDTRNASTPDIGADEIDSSPSITNFTPSTLCYSGGATVTITGKNFNNSTSVVRFNGVLGVVTNQTATTLTVTPPNSLTAGTISVTNDNGTGTSVASYSVDALSAGGSVSGGGPICSGGTSGLLTLSGHTGAIVRWESSVSPFSTWDTISNLSNTYTSGALTQTTKFRAVVKNGVCTGEATSTDTTVTISSTTWNGTAWSNGAPSSGTGVVFTGNYTASADLSACSIQVSNNASVNIPSGYDVTLVGSITVESGSSFVLENDANLIQSGTINNNSGNIVVKRNATMRRLDYTYWSSPVAGQNLKLFSPQTVSPPVGSSRFYITDEPTNAFVAVDPLITSFVAAKGYMIRAPNNYTTSQQTFTGAFTGVPNNGIVQIPATVQGLGYNMIGNPYPSPVDAMSFLNANPGTLYFWTKANQTVAAGNCYATFNLTGGTASNQGSEQPNGYIQTGQGFIIKRDTPITITFNNGMRVGDNGDQFFRTGNTVERNRIWLNLSTPAEPINQILIGYMTGATAGVDDSMDGPSIETGTSISSLINDNRYVIQARPVPFNDTDIVPLGFKAATAGTYILSINNMDGVFSNGQGVYLRDNLTGVVHDIKQSPYSFASAEGTFNTRFEILYTNSTLGIDKPVIDPNSVIIYKDGRSLNINAGTLTMASVRIFDIRGRLIYENEKINANTTTITTLDAAQQVLVVQITSDEGLVVTKKIMN